MHKQKQQQQQQQTPSPPPQQQSHLSSHGHPLVTPKQYKKFFLVATDVGTPIYFDHPNGRMLCPTFTTTQEVLRERFEQTCSYIDCGDSVMVFQQVGSVHYCVVSTVADDPFNNNNNNNNENSTNSTILSGGIVIDGDVSLEGPSSLRRQLQLLHDLLVFRVGPAVTKTHMFAQNQRLAQDLRPLVRAMCRLASSTQTVLVQGIESVELNEHIRREVSRALATGISSCEQVMHAVLLVGTKCAAVYSSPKSWVLEPRDILCLITYTKSIYDDDVNEQEEDKNFYKREQEQYFQQQGIPPPPPPPPPSSAPVPKPEPEPQPPALQQQEKHHHHHQQQQRQPQSSPSQHPHQMKSKPRSITQPKPGNGGGGGGGSSGGGSGGNGSGAVGSRSSSGGSNSSGGTVLTSDSSNNASSADCDIDEIKLDGITLTSALEEHNTAKDDDSLSETDDTIEYSSAVDETEETGSLTSAEESHLNPAVRRQESIGNNSNSNSNSNIESSSNDVLAERRRRSKLQTQRPTTDETSGGSGGAGGSGGGSGAPISPNFSGSTPTSPFGANSSSIGSSKHHRRSDNDAESPAVRSPSAGGAGDTDSDISSQQFSPPISPTSTTTTTSSNDDNGNNNQPTSPSNSSSSSNNNNNNNNKTSSAGAGAGAAAASSSNSNSNNNNNVKKPRKPNITHKFDSVYLHAPRPVLAKCELYSEQIHENTTLLLICCANGPNAPLREDQKKDLRAAASRVKVALRGYTDFLNIRESTHISTKSYMHLCPGLIHFIFVDRIRDRVVAPNITSLRTEGANGSETSDSRDPVVNFIKEKVWEMCFVAHEHQDRGYCEVGWRGRGVQYWFKYWIEAEDGTELTPGMAMNEKRRMRCYELYTMYLPFVSAQAITVNNKRLVNILKMQMQM